MNIDDLANVTATSGSGPKGEKTWHKVMRGSKGKYGTEILINVSEVNRAVAAKAHTFVDKNGDTILSSKPKYWEPKTTPELSGKDTSPPQVDLQDEIPF